MFRKNVLLIVILTLFTLIGNAQTEKGRKMVGFSIGSVFFNNGSTERSNEITSSTIENDNFGINLTPSIGWFISDDLVIGFSPTISYSKQKQVGTGTNGNTFLNDELTQYSIGIGGFGRYYFKGSNKNLRFFGQYNLSLGIAGGNNKGYEYESLGIYVDRYETKFSGGFSGNTGVNFGVSKFLNNNIAFDFYFGYNYSFSSANPKGSTVREYSDPSSPDLTQEIDFEQKFTGHNFLLGLGFQLFLDGKQK